MAMQFGVKVDIKIQSISDIITNSSTSVITIYSIQDKQTVKDVVNAILAISGEYTFDDLFEIGMMVDESASERLWDESEELQEKFPTLEDFDKHLESLSDDDLEEYAELYQDNHEYYDGYNTFYDGYIVTLKDGVEPTPALKRAIDAIHRLDHLFDQDAIFS